MGFKSLASYSGEKYGNWFRLQNDGDYADVIFLYRGTQDVMMADCHYVKSDGYSGYVTCCGRSGCPACSNGIRIQPKLFVPLFVLYTSDVSGTTDKIQFWDRTTRFSPQLINDVFRGYPNPSEFIFRITRRGMARDINTTYDIRAVEANANPNLSYDAICKRFGATFPDYYNLICKEVDQFELSQIMSNTSYSPQNRGGYGQPSGQRSSYSNSYGAVPRGSSPTSNPNTIPGTQIPYTNQPDAPNLSMPNVPLNARIPDAAPDPNQIPFGGSASDVQTPAQPDPLETDEDIDTTDLSF